MDLPTDALSLYQQRTESTVGLYRRRTESQSSVGLYRRRTEEPEVRLLFIGKEPEVRLVFISKEPYFGLLVDLRSLLTSRDSKLRYYPIFATW